MSDTVRAVEPRLVLCPGCARHVFSDVEACPFCARPRAIGAASLAAAVVVGGALLVSCSSNPQPDGTPTAEPPPAGPTAEPPPDGVPAAMYAAPAPTGDERVPEPAPQPPDQNTAPPVAPMYGPPPRQNDDR